MVAGVYPGLLVSNLKSPLKDKGLNEILIFSFVQNTYFVAFTEVKPDNYFDIANHIIPLPQNHTEREEKQIGYYQWVR